MALHNLHLYCNPHIDKDKVVEVGLRFNPRFPTKWLPTQLRVLDNVLCNLVKYQNENKILFYKRNTGNIDQRYNPHLLGHKVLVGDEGVLAKLKKAQLIKVKTGDNKTKVPREKIEKGYQIKIRKRFSIEHVVWWTDFSRCRRTNKSDAVRDLRGGQYFHKYVEGKRFAY